MNGGAPPRLWRLRAPRLRSWRRRRLGRRAGGRGPRLACGWRGRFCGSDGRRPAATPSAPRRRPAEEGKPNTDVQRFRWWHGCSDDGVPLVGLAGWGGVCWAHQFCRVGILGCECGVSSRPLQLDLPVRLSGVGVNENTLTGQIQTTAKIQVWTYQVRHIAVPCNVRNAIVQILHSQS